MTAPMRANEGGAAAPGRQQPAGKRRHWLTRQRIVAYAGALLIIYILDPLGTWLHWNLANLATPDPVPQDFLAFWSASHLALQGHAIDAYTVKSIAAVESSVVPRLNSFLPWLYPPTFLLFVYPFALLPYEASAILFLGATLVAFVLVVRAVLPGRLTLLTTLAFPGLALELMCGQNGFLTAAIMGLGLLLLPRKPVRAGIVFGLLCLKPHLAVLIPLAMLCSRSWKALFSTAVTALVLSAVSVCIFGTGTIMAFVHAMQLIQGVTGSGGPGLGRVPTFFSLARELHLPTTAAYAVQTLAAGTAIAAVIAVWSGKAAYELRAAALVCATLMVSPYLYDYDLVWYGLAIVWYCRYGLTHGFRRYEREWLVLLWCSPALGHLVGEPLHFQFLPLVTAGTLAMIVARVRLDRRTRSCDELAVTTPA